MTPLPFEKLWELISLQTAEAPKRSRSNLRLSFPPEHPLLKKKKKLNKRLLVLPGIFHIPHSGRHFSTLQWFLRQFPLIVGFSSTLIGAIHSTIW